MDGESSCKDLEYFSSGVTPTDLPLSLRSQSWTEEGVEKLLWSFCFEELIVKSILALLYCSIWHTFHACDCVFVWLTILQQVFILVALQPLNLLELQCLLAGVVGGDGKPWQVVQHCGRSIDQSPRPLWCEFLLLKIFYNYSAHCVRKYPSVLLHSEQSEEHKGLHQSQ